MSDGSMTLFEMEGGVLTDDTYVDMVRQSAKAYANAVREDMGNTKQRVN